MIKLPQFFTTLDDKQFWTIYFKTYYARHVMEYCDANDKLIAQGLIYDNGRGDL